VLNTFEGPLEVGGLLATWTADDFQLDLLWTGSPDKVHYRFYDYGKLIFEGYYSGSTDPYIDSAETIVSLLRSLVLSPENAGSYHFKDYTQEQIDWVEDTGETLMWYVRRIR